MYTLGGADEHSLSTGNCYGDGNALGKGLVFKVFAMVVLVILSF